MTYAQYTLATLLSVLTVAMTLCASAHVVLRKRDTRAAIGWIALIWLSPILGTIAYVLLGINRISRKAHSLRKERPRLVQPSAEPNATTVTELAENLGSAAAHLESLARLVGEATEQPLLAGNTIELFPGGDDAYPAMIDAINAATTSVALCSYIFNDDPAGRRFVKALGRAVERGVAVRVLVDDLGSRYHRPRIFRALRAAGVTAAGFMPTFVPAHMAYLNLRNHRKVLVVDGRHGFTGGMNIDVEYQHDLSAASPRNDLHFRIRGPVVADLMWTFADDWAFTTDEVLSGEAWFPALEPVGNVLARGVAAGPDQDADTLKTTLLGALAAARHSVAIMTPYFLPDAALMPALAVAAMRGVRVDILMPRENNLQTVQWATQAELRSVLEGGCRAWYSPPPFDHSKLMIVDRAWTFLGSANWDARSLRLNFEFNVECYDHTLAGAMTNFFERKLQLAKPITLEAINGRNLPTRLRDGVARLLSPYL